VNTIRTKYAISVVTAITILFAVVFAVNGTFATSVNLSKTVYQDQTRSMLSTSYNDGLTAIQDNEDLEAKGGSDNNMFESESTDESKSIDLTFADSNYITPTHAKSIATSFISAKTSDAKSVSLEGKYGNPIYSVDITKNGQSHEIDIDAITGKILTMQDSINADGNDASKIDSGDGETNEDRT
jgi:uncharacterized membrane protein YkoI